MPRMTLLELTNIFSDVTSVRARLAGEPLLAGKIDIFIRNRLPLLSDEAKNLRVLTAEYRQLFGTVNAIYHTNVAAVCAHCYVHLNVPLSVSFFSRQTWPKCCLVCLEHC